mgnify:CR=1 FL=1
MAGPPSCPQNKQTPHTRDAARQKDQKSLDSTTRMVLSLPDGKVRDYVLFHGINQLSRREYHKWVRARALEGEAWATELRGNVTDVQAIIDDCIVRLEAMAKSDIMGGVASFAQALPTALPLSRRHLHTAVETCTVTGLHARPCFLLRNAKSNTTPVYVHMNLLERAQSFWTVCHFSTLLQECLACYRDTQDSTETSLAQTCERFEKSPELVRLVSYLQFCLLDVHTTLTVDNRLDIASGFYGVQPFAAHPQ